MNEETKAASVDSPEFRELVREYAMYYADHKPTSAIKAGQAFYALITHINAWGNQLAASRAMLPVTDSQRQAAREDVIVGYMSSHAWRANQLLSKAQYDSALPKNRVDFDIPLIAMPKADVCAEMRALCPNCGGTGDVHRADGEWLGSCNCHATSQQSDTDDGGPDLSHIEIPDGDKFGNAYEQVCAAWHREPCGDTKAAIGGAILVLQPIFDVPLDDLNLLLAKCNEFLREPAEQGVWAGDIDGLERFAQFFVALGKERAASAASPVAGWVSVEERLPDCDMKSGSLGVEVIVYPAPEKGESTAFFGCRLTNKPDFYKYGSRVGGVTHWMPLPPAPVTPKQEQK